MQLCSKPKGARGIEPETFRGVSFYLSADHWTGVDARRRGPRVLWQVLCELRRLCKHRAGKVPSLDIQPATYHGG